MTDRKPLGILLLEANLITEDILNQALNVQATSNRRLGSILIKLGHITEDKLIDFLAKQQNHFTTTDYIRVDPDVIKIIHKYICKKFNCVPLCLENKILSVAMLDPTDTLAILSLEEQTGYIIKPMLASKSKIETGLKLIPYTFNDFFNKDNLKTVMVSMSIFVSISFICLSVFYGKIVHKDKYGTTKTLGNAIISQNKDVIIEKYYDGGFKLLGRGAHAFDSFTVVFKNKEDLIKYLERKKEDFSGEQLDYIKEVIN